MITATTAFIDLATYVDIEKRMYGADDEDNRFMQTHQKRNWFSRITTKCGTDVIEKIAHLM